MEDDQVADFVNNVKGGLYNSLLLGSLIIMVVKQHPSLQTTLTECNHQFKSNI